ncbi:MULTISPECIES: histidine kinase [Streptosporangium]|uniref:Two-component system LytT family sensor kinase n=1 Tax=Streptosporangium brasiliense TaxID=47480 RepID=A0ABT9QXV5_9ACTN|nr:histidine kinase [Streptosporangium brasiliense]MDP9861752.1 two-component system LytT family sensor kinase [Streptosporangium brasiliense]
MWSTSAWVLLCAASTFLGFVLSRRRPAAPRNPAGLPDEATFATLHIAALAAPSLRAGLTRDSARKAIRHLRALLGTSAIAVTDIDGVLAWDGAMDCHRDHAPEHARTVFSSGRPYVVAGGVLACDTPGCVIRGAAVVPLTVEGRVIGALAAYDAEVSAALVRTVTEVARWVSGQLELAELDSSRRRAMEAETRALRAQISPHFVYNSLTTIASFVRTDPERARELLMDFADFTRHALRRGGDFTTLADELRCVDRYLLLERARFGERLRFTVQVAPEALPVPVPFLCLQPLVENAIKHGIAATGGAGEVQVVVRDAGPEVHIAVEDDGLGMDPARARRLLADDRGQGPDEGGIGMANVDVRLRRIYGEGYGLVVETELGAGTRIRLRVPKVPPEL